MRVDARQLRSSQGALESFLNLTTPGGGYLLKFLTNDVNGTLASMRAGDFVEVATQFLGVWVSYGHCPSQDPPQSREGE